MTTTPSTDKRTARLSKWLVWGSMGGALLVLAVAYVLPPRLGSSGPVWLALMWAAFAVRTLVWHAGVFIALVGVVAFIRRLWLAASIGAVAGLLSLWSLVRPGSEAPADLVVVSANVFVGGADAAALAGWARGLDADVLLLQEYTPRFAEDFEAAAGRDWPHRAAWIRSDAFGQAVFSRLPISGVDSSPHRGDSPGSVMPLREGGLVGLADPQIRFTVEVGGRSITVQNVHTMPPIGLSMLGEQRELIRWLADSIPDGAFVVGGDFNCTQASAHLDALSDLGLRGAHTETGTGRGATWPSGGRLPLWMGFRIDHLLSSGGVEAGWSRVGPDIGGDHRPIAAGFRFTQR